MSLLRPLDPDRDGPALHAVFGDEESCRYLARPHFASLAETIAQLKAWGGPGDDTSWAVVENPDGPALGRVSLYTHGRDIWEAACMIVPAARGRNLAARALAEAIDYVFEKKDARRGAEWMERDGIFMPKNNEGSHHISINPRRLRDVREIIEGTWARREELERA